MSDVQYAGAEPPVDENKLEEALKRLLGREVSGILKSSFLGIVGHEPGSDPEKVLHGVESLNPWLAGLLRRSAVSSEGEAVTDERTQRSTSARKDDK